MVLNPTGASTINYGPASGTRTIDGNVTINGNASGDINLRNLTITGDLIVNTPGATVNNNAAVTGSVVINNVSGNTWNQMVNTGTIVFNDPDANTSLVVGSGATVGSLTLNEAAKVTVSSGATVSALEVKVAGSTVTNNGTVTTMKTEAPVEVEGNEPTTVTGSGNVSGGAVTSAPADGATSSAVESVTAAKATFLVAGLLNESNQQKPVTLAEAKTWIDAKYGVNFNAAAIVVTNGNIEIKGSILSTSDWNKVKANGDKAMPYRITLLKDDTTAGNATGTNKVIKVAMYQDGKAVLNNVDNSVITK